MIPIIELERSITLSETLGKQKPFSPEEGDTSFESYYKENIFGSLKQRIVDSEEYAVLFDYTFPVRRYVGLNTLNVIMTMKTLGPGLMYVGTKDVLTSTLLSALDGMGEDAYSYRDPQLVGLGDLSGMFQDASSGKNFKPKELNFGLMILMMFLKTPFLILKGLVEAFDPNIVLVIKVMNLIRAIVALLPDKAPDYVRDSFIASFTPPPGLDAGEVQNELQEKLAQLDECFRKVKEEAIKFLDDFPVPLMSMAMLPSLVPYGCGFPPPPLGPGIGPPLTPFGVAYLILSLWKDDHFANIDTGPRGQDNPDPKIPPQISELCQEKLKKWQEIAALGLIDSDPPEEDSD